MKTFEAKWKDLASSGSAVDEAARVEDVMAFVRANRVRYQLTISDAKTGHAIPVEVLGRDPAARLRIQVTVDDGGKKMVFAWEPRDPANVLPLLRE